MVYSLIADDVKLNSLPHSTLSRLVFAFDVDQLLCDSGALAKSFLLKLKPPNYAVHNESVNIE